MGWGIMSTLMASFYPESNRDGYRAQVVIRGRLRKLWLGKVNKSQAKAVCDHLEALKHAAELSVHLPPKTAEWLDNIGPRVRKNLQNWGLISTPTSTFRRNIVGFVDDYRDSRSDWQNRTISRINNVKNHLKSQLGDVQITSISEGDAKRFARWARENYAHSHSGKLIADARQIFAAAVDERIISKNPFAGIDSSQKHDAGREGYVTQQQADEIIAKCSPYFAAVVASVRYGGLRNPSELMTLEWSRVDWELQRVGIYSPKLARHNPWRSVPMFPKWRPHLEKLWDAPDADERWVFHRARSSMARGHRKQLLAVLDKLGIAPWPKLWQTLRASCQTDLQDAFESHVVTNWLGNSPKVAAKHYLRVTDEHYERAIG